MGKVLEMKLTHFSRLLSLLVLVLTACSSDPQQQALMAGIWQRNTLPDPNPEFVALAKTGAPAYVVSVENRPGAYAQFLRQQVNIRGEETWISGDGVSLGMKEGLVLATRGLGGDLMSADISRLLPAILSRRDTVTELYLSHLNANDETSFSTFRCRLSNRGARSVDLGPYVAQTDLMVADCTNGNTTLKNLYWLDRQRGGIVQSRQWISPHTGSLALRVIPGAG
ncbi:hypothetical protein XMD517_002211 [Aliiroseovarius sp. xm-d-517]|nr:hypothetical protein [Aliiroseovarius sp. xm-d-517]NRP40097.1 hypothetical protein [Aliiroseovarius sp. xm-m-339-2]NRP61103.1 hypothetical protein [Aliiroseovarius sp. xm-a-151]